MHAAASGDRTRRLKIALVTDAWRPQTNGVVTTLTRTLEGLERLGHSHGAIIARSFRTVALSRPTRKSAWRCFPGGALRRRLESSHPMPCISRPRVRSGRRRAHWCLREATCRSRPRTTRSFPQYVRARFPIPESWSYAFLRRFHGSAARVMVATEHMRRRPGAQWLLQPRVVDARRGRRALPPGRSRRFARAPRPILLYAGRVAVEKNLEAFLGARRARHQVRRRRRTGARGAEGSAIPQSVSPATSTARSWHGTSPLPMCSCFRAAPIRSGWCCSKRWRAACRLRHIRWSARSMS